MILCEANSHDGRRALMAGGSSGIDRARLDNHPKQADS
jgi:hypothetical protein